MRLALNDGLLSSYFDIMRRDNSSLSPYYKSHAFMRDNDLLEIAQKYIEGFEASVTFNLPHNSSLLNSWNHQTLLIAGIWAPAMKSHPVNILLIQFIHIKCASNLIRKILIALQYNLYNKNIFKSLKL